MWAAVTVTGPTPTGTTTVAAVIGDPVRHSLSPVLMNAAFGHVGVDWVYGAFEVPVGGAGAAVAAMRTLGLGGLNVTMPLKSEIVPHLDALSDTAARLGAVNCVARSGDRLVGHSTDGDGLVATLRIDEGFDPAGRTCAVIGAGGAARAAVAALAAAGAAMVLVVNRTVERARIAAGLAGDRGRLGDLDRLGDADLIVNATPLGMTGTSTDTMPMDPSMLGAGQLVLDMVYDPPITPLVAAARASGAHAVGGVGMLVHQAARAFDLWTGLEAPVGHMAAAAADVLAERSAP